MICMTDRFYKLLKTASFLLAVFSFAHLSAQNNKNNFAKELFQKNHKFGIDIGYNKLYTSNEYNSLDFNYPNQNAFQLGIEYNFYQYKNFNFKVGLIWRNYALVETKLLKAVDFDPFLKDTKINISVSPNHMYKLPLSAEYYLPITNNTSFSISLGPEIIIYPEDPTLGSGLYTNENNIEIGYKEEGFSNKSPFYFGLNTGVSFNIQTKYFLFKPYVNYHYQPKDLYTNVVTTQNLLQSPNTVSKHIIKGDYLGFGLVITPSKALFTF
jgi:hypothetical protein